nr:DNA polymerase Y family protein [Rubripirellula amarantea]
MARKLGIRVGMPIAQASELCAIKQGDVVPLVEKHDPDADREVFGRLAETFQDILTPLIAVEELDAKPWAGHPRQQSESLCCDITGAAHLLGGEAGVLRHATESLQAMNLAACMAIADHWGTAWAVAHEGPWCLRPADNLPPRSFIVPSGEAESAIVELPVRALRIEQATVDTLARLGVERVGHLLKLPRSGIAPRLGMPLVRRIEQALGEVAEPLGVHHAEAEHCESWDLEYPTMDQEILVDRARRLLERIKGGLATRKRGAQRLTCRLDLSVHPPLILEIGLFAPTTDVDHLGGLFANRLESLRLRSDVTRLTISVSLSAPLRTTQVSLFSHDPLAPQSPLEISGAKSGSSLGRLVDLLSGRLGRDRVVEVRLCRDPLPENAFDTSPLAGTRRLTLKTASRSHHRRRSSSRSSFHSSDSSGDLSGDRLLGGRSKSFKGVTQDHDFRDSGIEFDDSGGREASGIRYRGGGVSSKSADDAALLGPSPSDAMRRPLSLLATPVAMEVALVGGSFCREVFSPQLPERFKINGTVYRIKDHWGPERIETGWWSGALICRDYYRVLTAGHQWWWIYRGTERHRSFETDLADDSTYASEQRFRWFLHGRFA